MKQNKIIGRLTRDLGAFKENIGIVKELLEPELFKDEVIMVSKESSEMIGGKF